MIKDNIEVIEPQKDFDKKMRSGRKLIVKIGFDPTSPDLHLGHAITLKKLREFQDLGHKIVIIIGDLTTQVGDPTGRDKTRPTLSKKEIDQNAKTYINQISKIIDVSKIELKKNSEWFKKMKIEDVIKLLSSYTVGQIMARNDFKERFEKGLPIAMHEIFYPLLQGYDSVMVKADIEIGGTDQLFNLYVGRVLQEQYGQEPQAILCMPLLRGLDGVKKMSKSLGNYIGITESPDNMFGKTMSIPDSLIEEFLRMTTSFSDKERKEILKLKPMEAKKRIAFNVVEQYHSKKEALRAQEYFENKVQKKDLQKIKYKTIKIEKGKNLIDILEELNIAKSRSAIRNLITQGAVSLDGEKVFDINLNSGKIKEGTILKVGKLNYYKFKQ